MDVKIEPSWGSRLNGEFEAPYFQQLTDFVKQEYRQWACYPPGNQIFNAFNLCPFNAVKVVIIGQDPYHEPGQAEGQPGQPGRAIGAETGLSAPSDEQGQRDYQWQGCGGVHADAQQAVAP